MSKFLRQLFEVISIFALVAVINPTQSLADKASKDASEAGDTVKKAGRKVQDEACELVHGKMTCAPKKAKHAVENTVDKVNTESK